MQTATISASLAAAGAATEDDCGDRAFADGQWKCRRIPSWFLLRDQLLVTMPLGWRVSARGNGECSTEAPATLRGTLAAPMFYLRI